MEAVTQFALLLWSRWRLFRFRLHRRAAERAEIFILGVVSGELALSRLVY